MYHKRCAYCGKWMDYVGISCDTCKNKIRKLCLMKDEKMGVDELKEEDLK